jgi:hypothetical protein
VFIKRLLALKYKQGVKTGRGSSARGDQPKGNPHKKVLSAQGQLFFELSEIL